MNQVSMSGKDGFWARVRAALGRRDGDEPAYGQAAIARARGGRTQSGTRMQDLLRQGWAVAAQRNVSLCVMTPEIDRFAPYHAAHGAAAVEETMSALTSISAGLLPRPGDGCLRMGANGFMLVLPDMPLLMARDLAGRIAGAVRGAGLANRESHAGQVTLSIGLAVVNPQGKPDRKVTEAAMQALRKAQRRGLARLEIADLRAAGDSQKARAA